jgi:hypothetical protein
MGFIAGVFTRNLGLKLASAVVACAVWLWLDAVISAKRTVEVAVAPPGPGLMARPDGTSLEHEPVTVAVTLRGPRRLLDALDPSRVAVAADWAGGGGGEKDNFVCALGPEDVTAPCGLVAVDVRPREVTVRRLGP